MESFFEHNSLPGIDLGTSAKKIYENLLTTLKACCRVADR